MKNIQQMELQSFGFVELSDTEKLSIEGGSSFWEDLAYVAGVTVRCFREFTYQASQFQASLPPSLKK